MLNSSIPHKQDSTQQQPNIDQQRQAQDLMARYFDLPVELQKLYATIAMPVAEVAYGNESQVFSDDK